jgi:translation initiation factor IF-3
VKRVARVCVRCVSASACPGYGPREISGFFRRSRSGAACAHIGTLSEEGEISDKRARVNEQIRISPVRLIQDDGEQIGIVSIDEARERAEARGMDLVEVAAEARPPVVKMMDYGKYKYEADRARREARKKQHTIKVKEVKFRPGIEDHDYQFKVGHARRFLDEGNKVKLTMMFRGRQVTHPEIGLEVLSRVMEDLQDLGKVESNPNMEGRIMSMVVAPLKA